MANLCSDSVTGCMGDKTLIQTRYILVAVKLYM